MELKNIYKAMRAKYPAEKASQLIGFARVALAEGRSVYAPERGTFGEEFRIGRYRLRYCDNYAAAGFRLVGLAHDIAPRAVEHRGWFTRHDGDTGETYAGAVFLIPGKRGMARAVIGYIDSNNERAAILECSIEETQDARAAGHYGLDSSEWRDAAVNADGIAERSAEESRDYDTAWQAGAYYASNLEDIAQARKAHGECALALRDTSNETARKALKASMARNRDEVADLLKACRSLREGKYSTNHDSMYFDTRDTNHRGAFNEGAGRDVLGSIR